MKHRLRQRYGRAGGVPSGRHPGDILFLAHIRGFKAPFKFWAPNIFSASRKAAAHAYAYRTEVERIEEAPSSGGAKEVKR